MLRYNDKRSKIKFQNNSFHFNQHLQRSNVSRGCVLGPIFITTTVKVLRTDC